MIAWKPLLWSNNLLDFSVFVISTGKGPILDAYWFWHHFGDSQKVASVSVLTYSYWLKASRKLLSVDLLFQRKERTWETYPIPRNEENREN